MTEVAEREVARGRGTHRSRCTRACRRSRSRSSCARSSASTRGRAWTRCASASRASCDLGGGPFVTAPPHAARPPRLAVVGASCASAREVDALIFEQIDERRARRGGRDDILALLLERARRRRRADDATGAARRAHDDARRRPRDDASELAWAIERLQRTPGCCARLHRRGRAGDGDGLRWARPSGDPAPCGRCCAYAEPRADDARRRDRRLRPARAARSLGLTPTSCTTTRRSTPDP